MNITIVGGGTAGWIAAYFILKAQPKMHKITVVESSSIGIIGAGEGSTGILRDVLSGFFFDSKENINEFIEATDSTPKLGIRHVNWAKDSNYFAPIDISTTAYSLTDYMFKYALFRYGNKNIHKTSLLGLDYEAKDYTGPGAFHFDAHKIGEFFKDKCISDGVTVIDAVVTQVNTNDSDFVSSIILDSGQELYGDLFVDCTGFKRVLSSKIGVTWVDYSHVLPVNTAMPFLLDYAAGEEFVAETKATALSSGWMWDIPLKTRRGCGYVFDSKFISEEDAQKEVEEYLGRKITPIRFINFTPGHVDKFWKNNVLSLGLSSAFVEPLEASSIHNTIAQLALFVKEFLLSTPEDTFLPINQDIYNKRAEFLNQITIDFISLHYQGGRDDSPFWRHIRDNKVMTENVRILLEKAKGKIPGYVMMEGMWASHSIPLANYILAGMGLITPYQAYRDLQVDGFYSIAEKEYINFFMRYSRGSVFDDAISYTIEESYE
jgi:flavin-dependent dehydrogenase